MIVLTTRLKTLEIHPASEELQKGGRQISEPAAKLVDTF